MLQDVFAKLRALQEILSKKFEIDRDMKEIPKILTTKEELLNRLKKSFIDKNAEIEAKKLKIKDIQQKMLDAEAERDKYEQQMDVIKTQREYEALDKEIKTAAEKEVELRRNLQKEEKALEEMVKNLEKEEVMIKKQEEDIKTENSRIKHELKEKSKQLKSLQKEEEKITPGLDEEILFKFERIIRSKAGVGIVPIRNGICTGCHMILTGQFTNDVRLLDMIMFCPNCSRILFFPEDETENESGEVIEAEA
ncbi:MAG: nucleic acid-binding protein [Spirochaetales bacterium]|nr:nucleic acid-binding protein [Spirochaetales bacterium]